jgi:hypothetical protein
MVLLLSEISDGEIFVADHEPDLSQVGRAAHAPAEASEVAEVVRVFDLLGCRVAMDDDRLVSYECATRRNSGRYATKCRPSGVATFARSLISTSLTRWSVKSNRKMRSLILYGCGPPGLNHQ